MVSSLYPSHGGDEYPVYIPPCWLALSEAVLLLLPFGCNPLISICVWSDSALVGVVLGPSAMMREPVHPLASLGLFGVWLAGLRWHSFP